MGSDHTVSFWRGPSSPAAEDERSGGKSWSTAGTGLNDEESEDDEKESKG